MSTQSLNWADRYRQQAVWTRDLRTYLFKKTGLSTARAVLEVGCGPGVILHEAAQPRNASVTNAALHGLDISGTALSECQVNAPAAFLARGNALCLPYPAQSFDITYCHFLLLWVKDPLQALSEMKRVTRSQGHVLTLAEPDYTARVDRPAALAWLGKQQTESLQRQGADVSIGSHLADLFYQAGLRILETGAIQSSNAEALTRQAWEDEWEVLQADLAGTVETQRLEEIRGLDEQAWQKGEHRLNVPTYFAWGQV